MSFSEWRKQKYGEDNKPAAQPAPTKTAGSFSEWRKNKYSADKSAENWVKSSNALLNEVQSHFSKWRGKDDAEYDQYQSRISDLFQLGHITALL